MHSPAGYVRTDRHLFASNVPVIPVKRSGLGMCMEMGKTGVPWVPLDSHGNGNTIRHGMGMGLRFVGNGN